MTPWSSGSQDEAAQMSQIQQSLPTPPFGRLALDIAWREMSEPAVSHWTGSRVLKNVLKTLANSNLFRWINTTCGSCNPATSSTDICLGRGGHHRVWHWATVLTFSRERSSWMSWRPLDPHCPMPWSHRRRIYVYHPESKQRIRPVLQVDCVSWCPIFLYQWLLYVTWCCLISTDTKYQAAGVLFGSLGILRSMWGSQWLWIFQVQWRYGWDSLKHGSYTCAFVWTHFTFTQWLEVLCQFVV